METGEGGVTDMEEVIRKLKGTAGELAAELETLTDAQWQWRAADGRWTAQEIVEHLILVERGLPVLLRRTMQAPPTERGEVLTDEQVWTRMAGPETRRAQAPERVMPSGAWGDRAAAGAEFARLRSETIRYAETTADPLRERWLQLLPGQLDGVQTLLMMAGHLLRHTRQLQALRRLPGYPAE